MTEHERIAQLLQRLDAGSPDAAAPHGGTDADLGNTTDAKWLHHARYARRIVSVAHTMASQDSAQALARVYASGDALMAMLAREPLPVRTATPASAPGLPSLSHLVAPPPTDVDEREWDVADGEDTMTGRLNPLPPSRPEVAPLSGPTPVSGSMLNLTGSTRSPGGVSAWWRRWFGTTDDGSRAQPAWLAYAFAAVVVIALAPFVAQMLPSDPLPPNGSGPTADATNTDPGVARALAAAMAAPAGDTYPMEVLPPGALAHAEGFVAAEDIPMDRRGFGLYRRHLRSNSVLSTEPDSALGLRVDTLSRMDIREDTRVQAEELKDFRKPFIILRGTVVARVEADPNDASLKSTLWLNTPYISVEPVDEAVKRAGGVFYAVTFDQDNRSIVEVGRGSVRVTARDGAESRMARGGEKLVFHPADRRFAVTPLAADRMRQLAKPRILPKADALAMQRGLPFLSDDTDMRALFDAEFDTPQRQAPPTPPSGPQPADQKPPLALAGARNAPPPGENDTPENNPFKRPFTRDAAGNTWGHGEMQGPARGAPDAGLLALDEARRRQVERLYATVEAEIAAGQHEEALNRLSLFLQGTPGPESERGWYLKGLCLHKLGRRKDRNEAWFQYINRFPQGHWAAEVTRGIGADSGDPNDPAIPGGTPR